MILFVGTGLTLEYRNLSRDLVMQSSVLQQWRGVFMRWSRELGNLREEQDKPRL